MICQGRVTPGVEKALQDDCRRRRIQSRLAVLPPSAGGEQCLLGLLSRQPLVPEYHRDATGAGQASSKAPRSPGLLSLRSIGVQWDPDDDELGAQLTQQPAQSLPVLSPGAALQRGERGRQGLGWIADGNADPSLAWIKRGNDHAGSWRTGSTRTLMRKGKRGMAWYHSGWISSRYDATPGRLFK